MTRESGAAALPSVVFGLSHIVVPVADLFVARAFYVGGLGFTVVGERPGLVDLEAGMTIVRLCETPEDRAPVTLRLQAVSISGVQERVGTLGTWMATPVRTPELELTIEVRDPDGNRLVFWRPLTEDEYDEPVSLPMKKPWTDEAEKLMQSLLSAVPALFRDLARTGAVAEAEYLTGGGSPVEVEMVVRAYIRATPRLLRSRVRAPLQERGFDLDRYRLDFEV